MRNMKKTCLIMLALALVTGFTQCKKDQPVVVDNPVLTGETYPITLTLGGPENSKSGIDPQDGNDIAPVQFELHDIIYVAYNGKHCGTLECTAITSTVDDGGGNTPGEGNYLGTFTGTITATASGDQPLYFYHLGNKTATIASDNAGYTVDLSDQSTALPVISYAASVENFTSEVNTYTVKNNWLMNQCALVKFEMENIYDMSANTNDNNADAIYTTDKAITIYGMDNEVTVNLANNEFTWGQKSGSNGAITLYKPDTNGKQKRYAIVHHGVYGVTEGELEVPFNPSFDEYGFYGTYKIQGNIPMNDYFQDAKIDLVWHSGAFSVSASEKVVFSRGNLQYKHYGSSTPDGGTWRFAKHQYDYVGGTLALSSWGRQGNVVLQESVAGDTGLSDNELIGNASYVGWIDLYGYGTGDDPTKHSVLNTAYNDWHEWGTHNIVNSGKPGNNAWWNTLTHTEWKYLLSQRTNYDVKRGVATVNGVKGFILLPDYTTTTIVTYSEHGNWSNNTITAAQWKTYEAAGAVFLPAAGYRSGSDYDGGTNTQQDHGVYWSSSMSTAAASWGIRFKTGDVIGNAYLEDDYPMAPDNGHGVRLVHRLSSGSKFFGKKD